jgi:2,3-bisphosphoglycerate-dependent phosphoglycerate mutase
MKKLLFVLVWILCAGIRLHAQDNPVITTFILVRHAEKGTDGDDPDLKPEGHDRAKRLASMLRNTFLHAVYSTRYNRTKNTVSPVAREKGFEVQIYESLKASELDALIEKHSGQTILIGGHSNTIPQIANLLTGKEEFKNFPDTEYGNLLIISVIERGKNTKVTWLSY